MPVTADTFELEHFKKLVRGVTVACEAYDGLLNDLHHTQTELAEARMHLESYERELQESYSPQDWNAMVEFIDDVARGVRTFDELLERVHRDRLYA